VKYIGFDIQNIFYE